MSIFGWLMCLRKWTSANTCDLLKALIIIITSFLMQIVDTSIMYHQASFIIYSKIIFYF